VAVGATGNVLLYVKGGVAWTDWSVSATALGVTASVGDTATGYILGAGIEYGFTPNWTAKLEYNYLDFNGSSLTLAGVTTNYDLSHSVVKVGVNYKFGGYR
jgi:outer membrane immunogenic protein